MLNNLSYRYLIMNFAPLCKGIWGTGQQTCSPCRGAYKLNHPIARITLHSSSSKIAISKQEDKVCFRRRALLSPWEDRETWISVYSTTPPDGSYQLESGLCRRTILKQKNKNNGGESSLWLFFQSFLFLSIYFFVELVSIVSNLISQKS